MQLAGWWFRLVSAEHVTYSGYFINNSYQSARGGFLYFSFPYIRRQERCSHFSCCNLGPHNKNLTSLGFFLLSHVALFPPPIVFHWHIVTAGEKGRRRKWQGTQGFNLKFIPLWLPEAAWSMNPVLLFKKGITQVTHLLPRERPLACSSHASIQRTPLVCPCSQQEPDSCNLFLGLPWIAWLWGNHNKNLENLTILNGCFSSQQTVPVQTCLSSNTEAEILNSCLHFKSHLHNH